MLGKAKGLCLGLQKARGRGKTGVRQRVGGRAPGLSAPCLLHDTSLLPLVDGDMAALPPSLRRAGVPAAGEPAASAQS